MSFHVNWDIEKHREEHESDEHWELRKSFMERWKGNYPEERLICLARVFANIEFMGCRYPVEVMQEVAQLSKEVAKDYRNDKKTKLQRTFVSASDAAEDRARGVKREGGIIVDGPPTKSNKIEFVKQSNNVEDFESRDNDCRNSKTTKMEFVRQTTDNRIKDFESQAKSNNGNVTESKIIDKNGSTESPYGIDLYLQEMSQIRCLNVQRFRESMFNTMYGKLVLLVRPWAAKLWNIQASCQACGIPVEIVVERNCASLTINGKLVVEAAGDSKQDAKNTAGILAWNKLKQQAITVLVKDKWIAQDGTKVSLSDVSGHSDDVFGTPVETSVATKMMKLMGWKGGGLGVDSQGIAEPIKPHLQMVNRAGLGSSTSDIRKLRAAAHSLMRRYLDSATLDVDLVFSAEFSKPERAALHQVASKFGLSSKSYGQEDYDRFLVVKKKIDPFSIVRQVIQKGGETQKYHVFIPEALNSRNETAKSD